jgi:hypothetical protein
VFDGRAAAGEGELSWTRAVVRRERKVKRESRIDEFLARYRRGLMALKVLRWELEGKR